MEHTHRLGKKGNSTLVETLQPLAGRAFPKHTLPYNGLITHVLKGLTQWAEEWPCASDHRGAKMAMVQTGVTEAHQLLKNFYLFILAYMNDTEEIIPCFAWELRRSHNFLVRQCFPVCEESAIMISEAFF